MSTRIATLILFICWSVICPGQSNQVVFGRLGIDDGLSQSSVVAIAQDSLGYLWFATQDGLNRYDGQHFHPYEKYFWDITRENITRLGRLMVDQEGSLWILPQTGIPEKYNASNNTFTPVLPLNAVRCMFQDQSGSYFFGTANGLLRLSTPEARPDTLIAGIEITDGLTTGQLWLVANGKVVHSDDLYHFHTLPFSRKGPSTARITCLAQSRSGLLWAGSFGHGLFVKSPGRDSLSPFGKHLTGPSLPTRILSLFEDSRQRLWIGTYGQGLYVVDPSRKSIRQFKANKRNPLALSYNDILSITEDQSGVLWFGSDGAGLSFYDENIFKFNGLTYHQVPPNIQVDVVRALLVDPLHRTWLGTSGKGLTLHQPADTSQPWLTYTVKNSPLHSDRIVSLEIGSDSTIWVGTQGKGLASVNYKTNVLSSIEEEILKNAIIWDIHYDWERRLWLGTDALGLIEYHPEKGIVNQFSHLKHLLPDDDIVAIIDGNQPNELWVGTENSGFCRFNKSTSQFNCYRSPKGTNKIKCLYLDENGILWIGTKDNGLEVYDPSSGQFAQFDTRHGLPNKVVYGIVPGEEDDLWLSTNRGICRFKLTGEPFDTGTSTQITKYDQHDGLQSVEFNTGAHFKDDRGYIYFGGINGYNWFQPVGIRHNQIVPKVILTNCTANGTSILPHFRRDPPSIIQLEYWQHDLTFEFAATSYSLPGQNQFRYQLMGYDENQIEAGNRNFAQYTNLPPGNYEFSIQASNYDGFWNESGLSVLFEIPRPWYNNSLAWLAYAFFLCGIGYFIFRFIYRRWQLDTELKLKNAEAIRLKELDQTKSRFYTNITHEFRTPLTVILGLAQKLQLHPKQAWKSRLDTICKNGNLLMNLINQMLDLGKLQEGTLQPEYVLGDVMLWLKHLVRSVQSYAITEDLSLSFHSEPEEFVMDYDPEKMNRILGNLLSNAIKFTPKYGEIKVIAKAVNDRLKISISDTGTGIATEDMPHIFKRFYQSDSTDKEGTGIGLAIVKEMVNILGGTITATSQPNEGTDFDIELPVTKKAERVSEFRANIVGNTSGKAVTKTQEAMPFVVRQDKPLLLIIEDYQDITDYLTIILQDSYQILTARNGKEGLQLAQEYIPDLVLSDVMMPEMNGYEVCKQLKTDERTSHIPVVLLTAKASQKDREEGLSSGADAHLAKPFYETELLVQLERLILLRKKLQAHYNRQSALEPSASMEHEFLRKLNEFIFQHLDDTDLKAILLCKAMGLSRTQLHRKVKALTDLSTMNYVRKIRLEESNKRLKTGRYTVAQVAYQVGFKHPNNFSTAYKEYFGYPPSETCK